jgi:tRNA-2-methylthio-N6-dimethylallyladenosine synthase
VREKKIKTKAQTKIKRTKAHKPNDAIIPNMKNQFRPGKYHIKTYGCQANVADSNTMAGMLESLGFEETSKPLDSDLLIINTCSVRQKSEDKVYGMGKHLKRMRNKPFTIMAGCMVGSVTGERQRYEFEELKTRTPWVDEYINPAQIGEIPSILSKNKVLDEWALKKFDPRNLRSRQSSSKQAFVNISQGCDNFCTFCVVPYARGNEISRSEDNILREINHLVQRGITEITLCGQNVNSWGLDMTKKFDIRTGSDQKLPFANLLRKIHEIEEIKNISFISSNPFDFTNDLINVLEKPKIDNYLHIAVQSGNNDVLKRMNRRHTIQNFYDLIEKILEKKPNVELGTDIIVGFPGETRDQFMDTVTLFEKVKFRVAFISIYSPRKGTPAEKFYPDDVPLSEKKWRHVHLTKVWKKSKDD